MGATVLLNFQKLALPQGLRQALDVEGDFQGFQRRFDLDAQHCPQFHYPCQVRLPLHDHLQFIPVGNNGDPGVDGWFCGDDVSRYRAGLRLSTSLWERLVSR
ncbi:hypothetical protein D9M73_277970 [compost metagenome]